VSPDLNPVRWWKQTLRRWRPGPRVASPPPLQGEAKNEALESNFQRLIDEAASGALRWEGRPLSIELSTNNTCNLRCRMCSPATRPNPASMTDEEARELCDELLPPAGVLTPSAGSEPLLGNFEVLLERCRRYDVQLHMITNGTLLDGETLRRAEPAIGRLYVSFDSHLEELYESIRVGASYQRVLANLTEACRLARQTDLEVMVSAVLMHDTLPHVADYVRFMARVGVDAISFRKLTVPFPGVEAYAPSTRFGAEEEEELLAEAAKAAEEEKIDLHLNLDEPRVFAHNPRPRRTFRLNHYAATWQQRFPDYCLFVGLWTKVNPGGDVFPCCVAPGSLVMGNVFTDGSFAEIWNGRRYRQLREQMHTGRLVEPCRDCELFRAQRNLAESQES